MRDRGTTRPAIRVHRSSGWQDITWQEYSDDIEFAAGGLLALGVKPGDRVAIMANTRYEWGCLDLAVISVRGITVPVYQNNTPEDVEFILNDSQPRIFVAENRNTLRLWRKVSERCPSVQKVVCFETDEPGDPTLMTWEALKELGQEFLRHKKDAVRKLAADAISTDPVTIIYTSGTTGRPKGVVLGHEQGLSEVGEAFPLAGVTDNDISLCFLPFAHVLGRVELWGHALIGFTMAYAESIERIRGNLTDIKPTILVSVPRIFEKVYAGIYAQMENQSVKRRLFDWAVAVGKEVGEKQLTHELIPLTLLAQFEVARNLVLNKVRDAFGGRLRFAVSGGAPLASEISLFFHAAGVLILEGYGLTETTGAVTVNTPFNYRFGSVGRPIGDTQIKIAEDGEVLVRSKKVMQQYYHNPESNAEAFVDGWFKTGDIGEILPSGDLKITDRKKDLIKTAGGKYVAPQRLEALLQLQPLIGHALIHGDQKKYIVALLTLDRPSLEKYARDKDWSYTNWTDLIERPEIQTLARQAVADVNSQLASWESIKRFSVLAVEFTVDGGELTPSLKVKRKMLDQRYHQQIEALYDY